MPFKPINLIDPLTLLVRWGAKPPPPRHTAQAQVPVDIVASVAQSKSVSRRFMLPRPASSAITYKK